MNIFEAKSMYKYIYQIEFTTSKNISKELCDTIMEEWNDDTGISPKGSVMFYIGNEGILIGSVKELYTDLLLDKIKRTVRPDGYPTGTTDFDLEFYFGKDTDIKEIKHSEVVKKINDMHLDPMMKPIIEDLYTYTNITTSFSCESHPELYSNVITHAESEGKTRTVIHNDAYIVFDDDVLCKLKEPPKGWEWDTDRDIFDVRRKYLGIGSSTMRPIEFPLNNYTVGADTRVTEVIHKLELMDSLKGWVAELIQSVRESEDVNYARRN